MNSFVCKLANGFHSFEPSHIWNTREIYFKYSAQPYDTVSMFVTNYSASLTFENIVSLKENLGRFANNVRKQVRVDPLVAEILYSPVRLGE